MMSSFGGVLKSRKFWAAVVAILVSTGILQMSDAAEADLVNALVTVVTTAAYIIAVAIEDAGRAQGGSLRE